MVRLNPPRVGTDGPDTIATGGGGRHLGAGGDDVMYNGLAEHLIQPADGGRAYPDPAKAAAFTTPDGHVFYYMDGGDGNDTLYGTGGRDNMNGGSGDDLLIVDRGDRASGGTGADVFLVRPFPGNAAHHEGGVLIHDFEPGRDKLDISAYQNPAHTGWVWDGRGALGADDGRLHVAYSESAWTSTMVEVRAPGGAILKIHLGELRDELTPADFILGPQEPHPQPEPQPDAPEPEPPPPPRQWADEHQAQAARLYDTVLDRKPDASGLEFWHSALNQGHGLHKIASLFTAASEFQAKYGVLDDAGFVAQLYRNALDREGEREGLDFWTAALDQHRANRSDIVVGFSESAEHAAKVTAEDYLA